MNQTIKEGIDTANTNLQQLINLVAIRGTRIEAWPSPGLSAASSATSLSPPLPLSSLDSSRLSSVTTPPSKPPGNAFTQTRTLQLGNGTALTFTEADIPNPPAISFASDLPRLNRMWDDTSIHWDQQSVLTIHGCPIALIYWKDVYTAKSGISWKPGQWKGIKGKWFDWKVSVYENLVSFLETHAYGNVQILVQCWRKGSPEEFWSEFSENGKRLGYKAILARLAAERMAEDEHLSQLAKEEYGDQFSAVFSYIKGGRQIVKVKAADIAKQYRTIKGLEMDDNET